jgi:hypothetical protein
LAALWFMAGVCFTLTAIILLLPWLRSIPGLSSLPALPWQAGIAAVATAGAVFGLCEWLQPANPTVAPQVLAASDGSGQAVANVAATDPWAGITDALGRGAGTMSGTTPPAPNGPAQGGPTKAAASPMNRAIASLQARLAKGGGSADDWELLAKSYEFLGRPAEASKARAHQLPDLPADDATSSTVPVIGPAGISGAAATSGTAAASSAAAASGAAVSGEVALAPTLKAKATAGATLFIFAKSVDSPGPPVAVFRTTVGSWPVKFKLDDSESMLPGRTLSNARRVTVEARISQSGQPLAAAGDLQGTTGVIETADRKPLTVLIDQVVQ